jgi:hypothetical protein
MHIVASITFSLVKQAFHGSNIIATAVRYRNNCTKTVLRSKSKELEGEEWFHHVVVMNPTQL